MKIENNKNDSFKIAHKRYRRNTSIKTNDPDHIEDHIKKEIIDCCNIHTIHKDSRIIPFHSQTTNTYKGPMYTIKEYPGLVIIPQALSKNLQYELAYLSLSTYCEYPHVTNIDSNNNDNIDTKSNNSTTMFEQWKMEQKQESFNSTKTKHVKSIKNLSWSALGYHYNWTLRSYSETYKSYIPKPIQSLSNYFIQSTNLTCNYTASACIINYYTTKSIMGGHRDDLEYTFEKPIVSFSIGLPCIFLIGDDDRPIYPILLRSGDVVVMGGSSRLCYHSIPRIFTKDIFELSLDNYEMYQVKGLQHLLLLQELLGGKQEDMSEYEVLMDEYVKTYLSNHRININVRQVLPDGVFQIPNDG